MKGLLWLEIKKTMFSPALVGFAALCIVLNIIIIVVNHNLNNSESDAKPYNVFEGYSTDALADKYVAMYGMTGAAEENIRGKYDKLQAVIYEKAEDGDALFPYFGYDTYYLHSLLFGTVLFSITAECGLIAMFVALMLTGYENTRATEQIICSSKTGRQIQRTKLAASLITGLAAFAVILSVSLGIFFARYDFSSVWGDNVSSSFNYAIGDYLKPFITWHSFTVAGLLWAVIGISAGLTVVFGLFGFAAGTFFRNGFISCGAVATLCVLQFAAPMLFQMGGTPRGALNLSPVMLLLSSSGWLHSGGWFTDGGEGIIWANYESVGLTASFAVLAVSNFIAMSLHKRRDLL